MNLRGSFKTVVAISFFIAGGINQISAQTTPFDLLIQKFRDGQIFQAEFSHQYVDSYTRDTVSSGGQIWVGESDYKVTNKQQSVLVDGEISRVYDEDRNRLIVSNYEPQDDDFAPSRFLNGVDSTYTIASQKEVGDSVLVTLTSTDPFTVFKTVEITLGEGQMPVKIFARDQADNLITTTFESGRFIPYEESIFTLDYPDNAEVIDMRN